MIDPVEAEEDSTVTPVLWVRLDPDGEWLARFNLCQPEAGWVRQLESEKDVVAQELAIQKLRRYTSDSRSIFHGLLACVQNKRVFCHVRAQAARALGAISTPHNAAHILTAVTRYFKVMAMKLCIKFGSFHQC